MLMWNQQAFGEIWKFERVLYDCADSYNTLEFRLDKNNFTSVGQYILQKASVRLLGFSAPQGKVI